MQPRLHHSKYPERDFWQNKVVADVYAGSLLASVKINLRLIRAQKRKKSDESKVLSKCKIVPFKHSILTNP